MLPKKYSAIITQWPDMTFIVNDRLDLRAGMVYPMSFYSFHQPSFTHKDLVNSKLHKKTVVQMP